MLVQRTDAPNRTVQSGGAPAMPEELAALAQVLPALDELRKALEEHLTEDRELAGRGLGKLEEQYPEVNWPALRKLIHAWNLDEEETRRDVLLLGYREILERYGAPTTSWGGEQGIDWLYYDAIDPVTGETSTEVWIHFADGLVTDMGIKQP